MARGEKGRSSIRDGWRVQSVVKTKGEKIKLREVDTEVKKDQNGGKERRFPIGREAFQMMRTSMGRKKQETSVKDVEGLKSSLTTNTTKIPLLPPSVRN
jgi:site-specific recombinase XerD